MAGVRVYNIISGGDIIDWVGTKAEAEDRCKSSGLSWEMDEVPYAKGDLLEFLRRNAAASITGLLIDEEVVVVRERALEPAAEVVLSRQDAGMSVDVDATVRTICDARGYDLGRYARAVAGAYSALAAKVGA